MNSLFYWPNWYPQSDDSVVSASYELILHQPIEYKTYAIGLDKTPASFSEDKGETTIRWTQSNKSPRLDEDYLPPEHHIQMALLFAAREFELETFKGSTESWNSFANWIHQLWENKYELSPDEKSTISGLTQNCHNEREKISVLYSWLQKNTRYVAIEAGIHGFQPFPAQDVLNNRYGDYKALSALMVAMLWDVDITAYQALVKTRDSGITRTDFPSNQFNHVIACVPIQTDTVWLECTSNLLAAGELPYNDEDCSDLLLHENGGTIAKTSASTAMANSWQSCCKGRLTYARMLMFDGELHISLATRLFIDASDFLKRNWGIRNGSLKAYWRNTNHQLNSIIMS